jgi:hypothetical protein
VNLLEMHCAPEFICCCAVYAVLGFVCGMAIGWRCGAQAGMHMASEQAKHITERVKFIADLFRRLDATSQNVAAMTKAVDSVQPKKPCPEDKKHDSRTTKDEQSFSQTA